MPIARPCLQVVVDRRIASNPTVLSSRHDHSEEQSYNKQRADSPADNCRNHDAVRCEKRIYAGQKVLHSHHLAEA